MKDFFGSSTKPMNYMNSQGQTFEYVLYQSIFQDYCHLIQPEIRYNSFNSSLNTRNNSLAVTYFNSIKQYQYPPPQQQVIFPTYYTLNVVKRRIRY